MPTAIIRVAASGPLDKKAVHTGPVRRRNFHFRLNSKFTKGAQSKKQNFCQKVKNGKFSSYRFQCAVKADLPNKQKAFHKKCILTCISDKKLSFFDHFWFLFCPISFLPRSYFALSSFFADFYFFCTILFSPIFGPLLRKLLLHLGPQDKKKQSRPICQISKNPFCDKKCILLCISDEDLFSIAIFFCLGNFLKGL